MKKCKSSQICTAFSLVEVAMDLAIGALALVSLIGILPQFMEYERDSADQTAIGTIMGDIHDRLEGEEYKEGVPSISPIFYNQQGGYWASEIAEAEAKDTPMQLDRRFFRGEIELVKPVGDSALSESSMAVKIDFFWPLDDEGLPLGDKKPKASVTYYVTTLTGPDWEEIDSTYKPKIEY